MSGKKSSAVSSKTATAAPKNALQPPAVTLDRRGKPLPPRQRVGGLITPQ